MFYWNQGIHQRDDIYKPWNLLSEHEIQTQFDAFIACHLIQNLMQQCEIQLKCPEMLMTF